MTITVTRGRALWDVKPHGPDDHYLIRPDGRRLGCLRVECCVCGIGVELPVTDPDLI